MPEPSDPFQPQQGPDLQGVAQEWTDALNDPKVKASLLSFGLQAMQPLGFGQTLSGGLGQAIGAAGEGIGRQELMDRQQQESDAKVTLSSAKSLAEEARATTARTAADAAAERNRISSDRLEMQKGAEYNRRLQGLLASFSNLQKAQDEVDRKERFMNPAYVAPPRQTFEEWATKQGAGHILQGAQTYGSPTGGRVGAQPSVTTPPPVVDLKSEMDAAKIAIDQGKDPAAVRARFKQRTGQDLP